MSKTKTRLTITKEVEDDNHFSVLTNITFSKEDENKKGTLKFRGVIDELLMGASEVPGLHHLANVKQLKATTGKQVVEGGYHRPVCVKCLCEMRPERNGMVVLDTNANDPYELWSSDVWICPKCGIEVAGGFANKPISAHFEPDFQKIMSDYDTKGLLIRNGG